MFYYYVFRGIMYVGDKVTGKRRRDRYDDYHA